MLLLSSALVLSVLLISAVLATPSHSRIARAAHRRSRVRSRLLHRLEIATNLDADVWYTPNWAGAVQDVDAGTFDFVTGTFNVPDVWGSDGCVSSAWVGIDGYGCGPGLLQAGVDFDVTGDQVQYDAWYEWYPDWSYGFDTPIDIARGDTIRITIEAYSNTSGFAMVENLTNGQWGSKNLTSAYAICQESAEWIVEDFEVGTTFAPFANFSTVNFTQAEARGGDQTYTPLDSTIVGIEQNGEILTSTTVGDATVAIRRL